MGKFKFKLGRELKCVVTGFTGIATAKIEYLNGCIQYCIVPKVREDGKRPDGEYIDQGQLELVGEGVKIVKANTGGPQRDCPKN